MKVKALLAAALIAAFTATGCGSKSGGSSSSEYDTIAGTSVESEEETSQETAEKSSAELHTATRADDIGLDTSQSIFEKDYAGIPDADEGPLLKISNTTAKAGETAEVTISVENAEGRWDMCGIHIAYPDELECVMEPDAENEPEYETGAAVKKAQATVARKWSSTKPDDLKKQGRGAVFFTAVCPENQGRDGDIVTFRFKVPADAPSGKVYDICFYYSSNEYTKDLFSGSGCEPSFEKYAFSHCTAGTVTVE